MMVTNDSLGSEAVQLDAVGGDAAAVDQAWVDMCAQPMDAVLFVRLLGVCDFRVAEATVLWDVLADHRVRGLGSLVTRSGIDYVKQYGGVTSGRTVRLAISSLEEQGLIELAPVVRNVSRKFRLNWPALYERLSVVNPLIPGLGVAQSA